MNEVHDLVDKTYRGNKGTIKAKQFKRKGRPPRVVNESLNTEDINNRNAILCRTIEVGKELELIGDEQEQEKLVKPQIEKPLSEEEDRQ